MVRPGTVLPLGAVDDRPDYDYADGVTFRVYELTDGGELTCCGIDAATCRGRATKRAAHRPTRDRQCLRRCFGPLATSVRRSENGHGAERCPRHARSAWDHPAATLTVATSSSLN